MRQPGLLRVVNVVDDLPQGGQHGGQVLGDHLLDALLGRTAAFDLGAAADLGGLLLGLGDDLDRLGPHVVEVVLGLGGHVVEIEGDAAGAELPIGGADHGGHADHSPLALGEGQGVKG